MTRAESSFVLEGPPLKKNIESVVGAFIAPLLHNIWPLMGLFFSANIHREPY